MGQRLTRDKEFELKRITKTDAFRLFVGSQRERILDTDFYEYLGVTVRTPRNDFLGRLKTVEEAVVAAPSTKVSSSRSFHQLHRFVITKFSNHIKTVREGK